MNSETRGDFRNRMDIKAERDRRPDKRSLSEELARQVAEFKRNGGHIETIAAEATAAAIPVVFNGNIISYDEKGTKP